MFPRSKVTEPKLYSHADQPFVISSHAKTGTNIGITSLGIETSTIFKFNVLATRSTFSGPKFHDHVSDTSGVVDTPSLGKLT